MSSWVNVEPGDPRLKIASPAKNPEEQEQKMVMQWAQMHSARWPSLENLIHIPNGGGRSKAEAAIFKAMGVKAGVSDLFLPEPMQYLVEPAHTRGRILGHHHGFWIELKAIAWRLHPKDWQRHQIKMGEVSQAQLDWLTRMLEAGYAVSVAWDRTQAQSDLELYLTGKWEQKPLEHYLTGRVNA